MAKTDFREKIPPNVIKGPNLKGTTNALLENFSKSEKINANLVNKFINQKYFTGEESLIDNLVKSKPDLKFDDIENEGINLAILMYYNGMWDLRECLKKITNDNIKEAFIHNIHDKVQAELGGAAPYTDFDDPNNCGIPGNTNVLGYFQNVVFYLEDKERAGGGAKKAIEILQKINITNKDLNDWLTASGSGIPAGTNLSDPTIPADLKNAFDTLLSFEIGKEANRTINICKDVQKNFDSLLINSFPAINTIVGEHDEYKYTESRLGDEYKNKEQAINANTNLSENGKKKLIRDLKWEYYLKYLKSKNAKIGNTLEQLYKNDFDYDKIDRSILKEYIDAIAGIRFKMLSDSGLLNEAFNINFGNIDNFESFYKDLADISKRTIDFKDVDTIGTIQIPVQKKIKQGPNKWLKDLDEFGKNSEKSYDTLPIEYIINKDDFDREVLQKLTIEDKEKLLRFLSKFDLGDRYEIKGEDIGNLIYLYFVINSKNPLINMDPEKQKEVENLFGKAENKERKPKNDPEDDEKEKDEKYSPENFKEEIEKLGNGKFENGAEIRMPAGKSDLPGGGYQWMKIKISKVNMTAGTFVGTAYGGELKFSNKLEGKTREFKMDKETLEELKKAAKTTSGSNDKLWLLPNPNKSDFNHYRESLNNKLGNSSFSFPVDGTTWNGNKFTQTITDDDGNKKEVEVKYFGSPADEKVIYKIEYNPNKKSFTVSSTFNGDEKGKNGKSEKKRFSYKRDMDWNNFLIFFTQKGLIPKTKEQANDAIARQDKEFKMENGGGLKLKWFSISNLKNVFKSLKGNIKKKIEDYNKDQDSELEDILVGDWGIYNKLYNILGRIPSMKEGLGHLQNEYYNERDNRTWKEIEKYLKIFQSDPSFGDTFDQVPPFARMLRGNKSYKQFLLDLSKSNTKSKKDIYKAAALLLANIEKGSSPYRGLTGKENSGFWIKVLLGKQHYNQFIIDKQKCINDLKKEGKNKDQIQDVLATCEMDYIINNISGSNGKLGYFGSHESRGIPGKDGTNYIDNPSKILLSNQFADKLKSAYKGRFNKSSVDEAYGKITHNDFNLAKEDFKRLLKSSRFPGAIANLNKMFSLAKTDEHKAEFQKCFLIYMLSGILDVNGKKDLRKQTYEWAKTMSFLPGMLAKETGQSEKVVTLLDDFCEEKHLGKFSESVKSYFHEGSLESGKDLEIEKLIKELDSRWTVDKMKDFENYSKFKFTCKSFPEGSTLKKLQNSALDPSMENINYQLLENSLIANSGGILSNANVVRDRMAIKDGNFDGKDPDEKSDRAAFWNKIAEEVEKMNSSSPESVNLVLNQYFSRFGLNSEADKQKAYKRIHTAYCWKDVIGAENIIDYNGKGQNLSMGPISKDEIDDILWYTFQGTVRRDCFSSRKLPPEMEEALKSFQHFFKNAFESGTLKHPTVVNDAFKSGGMDVKPMELGSRNVYKDVFAGDGEFEYDSTEIGDENEAFKDPKKRRKAQKRVFQTRDFINYEMAQIEKTFKNRLPKASYRVLTQDTSSNTDEKIEDLKKSLKK